ncbi:hypothetical protein B5F10_18735 [Anaerotruncus colihominis]|uniref:DUF2313 domain-containing protein n=1 Tax=Anaerotruncus colihominis TaxID=169435 RepID=A0A1Y4MGC3_9FIRM|nr:hypothetical protein B5F11_18580 [Anaerotruncus colihominis]OUP70779.1 hypothetical protein B5F10_18735 [Anaerotruncus colihominis]
MWAIRRLTAYRETKRLGRMRYRCGVMWLDRKLIDYLPPVLQQTREMQAVMEGEQPAVAGLWDAWKTVLDALFVRYANEQGLARWERMLGIRPRGTDSMEVRRVAVLARLNEQLPFTERTLRLMLDGVCGPGGYTLEIIYSEYRVFVRVHLWEKRAMDEAAALLGRVVPANMVIDLGLRYNTHRMLRPRPHRMLRGTTHRALREEVLA